MANNEIVGKITCPFCESDADVKQNVKQKYYFNCKSCGIANLHGKGFQAFIEREAVIFGVTPEPEPLPSVAANDEQFEQEKPKRSAWGAFWSDEQ
jgi:hypothetical protein